ncbi:MAG: hypothetical protein A3C06_04610 [Candidatus Taylorbacteria bacterium RIFCSPHIGHO2_02_FULL_46_13]|uniref:tRNA-dihydrouridine synthase n=1 Tax=Candidatus Taylorbacteria bacterium RIFCSPHIGHO2_02_FULL_46_13 TaxID=1802312 RepID=A0A1G2MT85_9BACT|nr:MAG: hypothetical protein A3C06_04610 [Candidatus Taylorbacteria bacterium RIFCSPHIGHO2_02_FULL_46_13]
MVSFWNNLPRPFFALAPLADVTDAAFRSIISEYGKPDVSFTEFTSADGLVSAGREKLLVNLKYSESERPIVAQLFSANPEKMYEAAKLVAKLGFDGLDINMGCPDRSVCKQGAGGALIRKPKLAQEIIRAAKEGVGGLPVSLKTRIGYSKDELVDWLPALLETGPAAVTIHARTVKEMSLVSARWQYVAEAVAIRDSLKSGTLILGNGDAVDLADARQKVKETGADGVMLGRAIFGNPWLFAEPAKIPSVKEKLSVMLEHARLFEEYFKGTKHFAIMKKHFKAYVSGFDGAKEFRGQLMEAENLVQVEEIVGERLKTLI